MLYAALAWVVWRARTRELGAIGRLEAQNRELTLIQHFTRSVLHPLDLPPLAANMLESAVTGLGLAGAALYATGPRDGPARIAGWPPSADDHGGSVREVAVEAGERERAVIRGDTVAMPLPTQRARRYLVVARFRHAIADADLAAVRTLEIMLSEAAIALENAELFGEVQAGHAQLIRKAEELERANRALQETQARLVERERLAAAGEIVVGLHHAILNPLTGVLGAFQVLKHEPGLRPAIAQVVTEAEGEIRKIEQVVRRLASLRRVERTPYVGGTAMLDVERSSE
jgi:C4-dicarboxylate-specific signal transduction histidine kinase